MIDAIIMNKNLIYIFLTFMHFYMFPSENCASPKKGKFLELIKKDISAALGMSCITAGILKKSDTRNCSILMMFFHERERYKNNFDTGEWKNFFSMCRGAFVIGCVTATTDNICDHVGYRFRYGL